MNIIPYGGGSTSSVASLVRALTGSGPAYINGDQIFARAHRALYPMKVSEPDGIGDDPVWSYEPRLGFATGLGGGPGFAGVDQKIVMGAGEWVDIKQILISRTSADLSASPLRISIATDIGKAGRLIVPATQGLTELSLPNKVQRIIPVDFKELFRVSFLSLRVEVAHTAPVTFDVAALGDIFTPRTTM